MFVSPKSKDRLALALAAAAVVAMVWSFWIVPPRVDKKLATEIGRILALESLKLLGPGGKLTVIARDPEAFPQPTLALSLASLQRELKRAGAEIRSTQLIQLDPIRPSEVPPGDFLDQLRRGREGDVIVSLLALPRLSEEQKQQLGQPKAKIVALCGGSCGEDLKRLFSAGLLHVAIVDKPLPTPDGARNFERLYTVLRANSPTLSAASL